MALVDEVQTAAMEGLEDWLESEIARELEAVTIEDLEWNDYGEKENETEVCHSPRSPPLCPDTVPALHTYLSLSSAHRQAVSEDLNMLIKEFKCAEDEGIKGCPALSPPMLRSPSIALPTLSKTFDEIIDDCNEPKATEIEVLLMSLKEEQYRLESVHEIMEQEKEKKKNAVTIIQAYWRGYRVRNTLTLRKKCLENVKFFVSASIIQFSWKRYLRDKRKRENNSAVILQHFWKRHRCRSIAKSVQMIGRQEKKRKEDLSARKIQFCWKQYKVKLLVNSILAIGKKEKELKEMKMMEQKEKEMKEKDIKEQKKKEMKERYKERKLNETLEKQQEMQEKEHEENKNLERMERNEEGQEKRENLQQVNQLQEKDRKRIEWEEKEKKERMEKEMQVTESQQKKQDFGNNIPILVKSHSQSLCDTSYDQFFDPSHDQSHGQSLEQSHDHSHHSSYDPCFDHSQNELAQMFALREIRSQEELCAQHSRERMSQLIITHDQLFDIAIETRNSMDYNMRLDHASTPYQPHAWNGVVNERIKEWQERRTALKLPKALPNPLLPIVQAQAVPIRPLSDAQLLASSPQGTLLTEVTVVYVFRNRNSSIDFKSLSRCPNIRILSLVKCSLVSISDIGDKNPAVQEIILSSNRLELIDFSKLLNLRFIDLSDNHLSSIHGLQYCRNLLELNLNDNRVARIGGLNGCGLLQKLTLDSNLIINSTGIVSLPHLQHLSISENHLPVVVGLEGCPLLQYINLEQNNLQECISLPNHVLLRELDLAGNSLSDISAIEDSWLPLLQTLKLTNNCISRITSLTCCMMLSVFDIRHNSLYDFPSFLQSLRGCYKLACLSLDGNPITHEPKFKNHLLKVLPSLQKLDDVEVKHKKSCTIPETVTNHPLMILVSNQLQEQDDMKARHQAAIDDISSSPSSTVLTAVLDLKVAHCIEYDKLLQKHYQQHVQFNGCHVVLDDKKYSQTNVNYINDTVSNMEEASVTNIMEKSVTTIQKYWRGYKKRIQYRKLLRAIVTIQCQWRRHYTREWYKVHLAKMNRAAVIIQSSFRGYKLRKKLKCLLAVSSKEENEDIDFDESYMMESFEREEDHIRPFSPSEDEIDKFLKPVSSPMIPDFSLPGAIQEEVPMNKSCDSQVHVTVKSSLPSKNKLIMNEWGFTNAKTANLMRKRASRHHRLAQMSHERTRLQDPNERLSDFNSRRNTSHSPTKYQWSHKGKVIHCQLEPSSTVNCNKSILPQMELHVLAGHTPRLVTSKAQNEVARHASSFKQSTASIKQAWDM